MKRESIKSIKRERVRRVRVSREHCIKRARSPRVSERIKRERERESILRLSREKVVSSQGMYAQCMYQESIATECY